MNNYYFNINNLIQLNFILERAPKSKLFNFFIVNNLILKTCSTDCTFSCSAYINTIKIIIEKIIVKF